MIFHPGGKEITLDLLRLAEIVPPADFLDLGAGGGESVRLLKEKGFNAIGVDISNSGNGVLIGDLCRLDFENNCFDAILSECSFSVCGNQNKAFSESSRVLKIGGKLLLSDIYYKNESNLSFINASTESELKKTAFENSFKLLNFIDRTNDLKKYFIECIWNGCSYFKDTELIELKKAEIGYYMMVCEKS